MHLLFHIVYAAHAGSAHDKLALDALRHLECSDSGRWQRLFLAHAGLYLEGARVPEAETEGADLRGSTPEQARSWYTHVVEALRVKDRPTAVYCAGVLSRCVMDPLRPFRGAILRRYAALYALGLREFGDMRVGLASDPGWLMDLISRGAVPAHRSMAASAAGLHPAAGRILAQRLRFAYLAYAAVLGRAIAESRALAPEVGLGAATLLAAAQAPAALLARHGVAGEEHRAIEVEQPPDRSAQPAAQVLLFTPRERVAQVGQTREASWQAGADIIPLRRAAAPLAPPSATTAATGTSNVTRQPMLFLVPSEGTSHRTQAAASDRSFGGEGSDPLKTSLRTSS